MASIDNSYQIRKVGPNHVGSYQISGRPFATGSLTVPANTAAAYEVSFPYIVIDFTVRNDNASGGDDIKIGFSDTGVSGSGTNYFTLGPGDSYSGRMRISELYLQSSTSTPGTASVVAALTGIQADANYRYQWSGSVGVG